MDVTTNDNDIANVTWKFNYFLALDLVKWFPYAQI
ncbi:uncharacterized protein METZ01_LOCUS286190 [marine metagenome]|uniref:Uncharacterized protein n=1 Tax=marine metagenome TaxID=408172 RepID=A0A382L9F1_9ZZZZ